MLNMNLPYGPAIPLLSSTQGKWKHMPTRKLVQEYSQQLQFYRPGLEAAQMPINWQVGNKTGWMLTVEHCLDPYSGASAGTKTEPSSDTWYKTTLCQLREGLRCCDSVNMRGPEKRSLRTQEAHRWLPGAGPRGCSVGGEAVLQRHGGDHSIIPNLFKKN